ncbi:DUF1129 domain-containing protein [Apilactobacillus sp. M161]|uniref:DUF1129 domain-containing protein n=1 Tax=Apilactobacillus xinyiensis TaxID=2841032 RepID=A0ABT0I2Z8_9LACO|nr:DUF1129 family protein [Apilactobacillus xinyiensis]MCK8625088.1 DUF1129 domain-containing protein [Apilactobacillus xinyiensis]
MAEKRNAHVKQNRTNVHKQERSEFDNLGLTKKNADYMFRFNRELTTTKLDAEKKSNIIRQMVKELLDSQKNGVTARGLYGTVSQRINAILNPPKKPVDFKANFWPNAVYNALAFYIIFNVLYGVMLLINRSQAAYNQAMGIVSITLIAIVVGIGMPLIYNMMDMNVKHKYNGWMRALFIILIFMGWIVMFTISSLIPRGINPVVSPYVNFGLAVISIAAAIYTYHKYDITVNFLAPRAVKK